MAKKDLPAMPFYTGDWKKDPIVQMMDYEDQGIYLNILMIMWESDRRGFLTINGSIIDESLLSKMLNLDNQRLSRWLSTYQTQFKIFGKTEDGILFSRKHIKLVDLSEKRKTSGKLGGNPILLNQKLDRGYPPSYPNAENENESLNENESKDKERTVSSVPEITQKEVIDYFESCGYPKTDAQNFFSYYSTQNWETNSGVSIKARWRNKVIQWMNNQKQFNIPKNTSKFTATEEKYYDQNKRRKNDSEFKDTFQKNEKKIAEQGLYNPLADPELQKIIGTKKVIEIKPKQTAKEIDKNSPEYRRKLSLMNQEISEEIKRGA
jgi:hypothetical protein